MFYFMDRDGPFEHALKMVYEEKYLTYSGSDFLTMEQKDILRVLQTCLLVTVGDSVKLLDIDV